MSVPVTAAETAARERAAWPARIDPLRGAGEIGRSAFCDRRDPGYSD